MKSGAMKSMSKAQDPYSGPAAERRKQDYHTQEVRSAKKKVEQNIGKIANKGKENLYYESPERRVFTTSDLDELEEYNSNLHGLDKEEPAPTDDNPNTHPAIGGEHKANTRQSAADKLFELEKDRQRRLIEMRRQKIEESNKKYKDRPSINEYHAESNRIPLHERDAPVENFDERMKKQRAAKEAVRMKEEESKSQRTISPRVSTGPHREPEDLFRWEQNKNKKLVSKRIAQDVPYSFKPEISKKSVELTKNRKGDSVERLYGASRAKEVRLNKIRQQKEAELFNPQLNTHSRMLVENKRLAGEYHGSELPRDHVNKWTQPTSPKVPIPRRSPSASRSKSAIRNSKTVKPAKPSPQVTKAQPKLIRASSSEKVHSIKTTDKGILNSIKQLSPIKQPQGVADGKKQRAESKGKLAKVASKRSQSSRSRKSRGSVSGLEGGPQMFTLGDHTKPKERTEKVEVAKKDDRNLTQVKPSLALFDRPRRSRVESASGSRHALRSNQGEQSERHRSRSRRDSNKKKPWGLSDPRITQIMNNIKAGNQYRSQSSVEPVDDYKEPVFGEFDDDRALELVKKSNENNRKCKIEDVFYRDYISYQSQQEEKLTPKASESQAVQKPKHSNSRSHNQPNENKIRQTIAEEINKAKEHRKHQIEEMEVKKQEKDSSVEQKPKLAKPIHDKVKQAKAKESKNSSKHIKNVFEQLYKQNEF
jgi:hypothetical protein